MGVGREFIQRLLDLKVSGNLKEINSVAEIGNQQLGHRLLVSHLLAEFFEAFGATEAFDISSLETQEGHVVHGDTRHQVPGQPNSRLIWHAIGARYTGFDLDDDPDTVKLDLNFDSVPEQHKGQYDLVTNLGTTEHVLNQYNAFKVMHELCRPGGLMIHEVPAGGYPTHGFFNYNPKTFWQLAKANNYIEVDGGIVIGLKPENDYRVFEGLSDYFSRRMWAPWIARQVRTRDVGFIVTLAKVHDEPFRMALDVGDFGSEEDFDKVLKDRYPSYFGDRSHWDDIERHGSAFNRIFRHLVDEDFSLRSAEKFGRQYAEAIRSLVIYPNEGDSRPNDVCHYLDQVSDLLVSAFRRSTPPRRQSVTVDLASEDFVGLEWGYSVANSHGQKWRYLGPRDRSHVLLSLAPGKDFDVEFDILDLKPGLQDTLAIECNGDVLPTVIRANSDGLVAAARVPAETVARDHEISRVGLTVPDSPNRNRPGNSLTDIPPNRASLTEMRVRPAGNET